MESNPLKTNEELTSKACLTTSLDSLLGSLFDAIPYEAREDREDHDFKLQEMVKAIERENKIGEFISELDSDGIQDFIRYVDEPGQISDNFIKFRGLQYMVDLLKEYRTEEQLISYVEEFCNEDKS